MSARKTDRRTVLSAIAASAGGLASSSALAAGGSPGRTSLSTSQIRVDFDPLEEWGMTVADRSSGVVLASPRKAPLFELVLANADGSENVISCAAASRVQVVSTPVDGRPGLSLEFSGLDKRDIDVVCSVSQDADGALTFAASIRNGGNLIVRALRYPIISLNPKPSDGDSYLLAPLFEGHGVIRNPHRWMPSAYPGLFKFLRELGLFGRSPGNLSAQFAAYFCDQAGLYTAALDSKGWLKELQINPVEGRARLAWLNSFNEALTPRQSIDYPIVLTSFHGDWYDAADLYKPWARKQPWCAKTLLQRDDIPKWLKSGALWLTLDNWLTSPNGKLTYYGANLEELMAQWAAVLPVPPVLHYRWFEKYGYGATGLDWKPFWPDEETLSTTLGREKTSGRRGWVMLDGYNLTIAKGADKRGGIAFDDRERFRKEAAPYAVRDPKGMINSWMLSWIPDGVVVELCRGSAWTQAHQTEICDYTAKLGFSLAQSDQTIGGGGATCYAKDHGHPPGAGTWFTEAYRQQLRSYFRAGRKYDPEFHVSEEAPNELFLQELGCYQSRDHAELPPYITPDNFEKPWDVRSVPLFAYLYHPYVLAYTSWVGRNSGADPLPTTEALWETVGVTAIAKSMLYGKAPGVWEQYFTPDKKRKTLRYKALMQHAALTAGESKRYLLFGDMLRPPPIEVDTVIVTFRFQNDLNRDYPKVMHTAYEDVDGKRGVFLANITGAPTDCTLKLGPTVGARKTLTECRLVDGRIVRTPRGLEDRTVVTLAPVEMMYLELA